MFRVLASNIVIISFVFAFSSINCKKDSINSAHDIVEFESRLDQLKSKSNIPGMVAGIEKNGQVIWTKGLGFENIESGKPVSNTTIFL